MNAWFSPPVQFAACLLLLVASSLPAQETTAAATPDSDPVPAPCPARNDEVWLISTRHLCYQCGTEPTSYELDVRQHDEEDGWRDSSLTEFLQLPPLPLVVYVHGNRYNWFTASQHGWRVYESLTACCRTAPRMRFVIWSWPSDQVRGPLRDIRQKADRAETETFFLGGFLSQLDPNTSVGLVGYSYGVRIISGGLHLLAGGSLGGTVLSHSATATRVPVRVAMLAAAMDHDALCPGHCYGAALEQVDRLLVLYNSCDPALQRYSLADRRSHDSALGYVGLPWNCLGSLADRAEQLDAAPYVGRMHDVNLYFGSDTVTQEIARTLFDPLLHPLPIASGSR